MGFVSVIIVSVLFRAGAAVGGGVGPLAPPGQGGHLDGRLGRVIQPEARSRAQARLITHPTLKRLVTNPLRATNR